MHTLTILCSREVKAFSCCCTQSLVGTASFFNHRFVWKEEPSPRFRSSRCSKSDNSKCTEHSTDVLDGCHFARCLRTKRTHFSRVTSLRGNLCIDMPSVLELLVQLTFPGPPATQYLPKDLFGASQHFRRTQCSLGVYSEFWDVYNQWRHKNILAAPRWPPILGSTSRVQRAERKLCALRWTKKTSHRL